MTVEFVRVRSLECKNTFALDARLPFREAKEDKRPKLQQSISISTTRYGALIAAQCLVIVACGAVSKLNEGE